MKTKTLKELKQEALEMKNDGCLKDSHLEYFLDDAYEAGQEAERTKVRPIFRWLLGLEGDFPTTGKGKYHWRIDLMKKIGSIGVEVLTNSKTQK